VDPITPSTIYAGTRLGGVFKSTNGGGLWTPINNGLPELHMFSLAIDPYDTNLLYVGTEEGIYRSRDAGMNWEAFSAGLPPLAVNALAIDPVESDHIYAGTSMGVFEYHIVPALYINYTSGAQGSYFYVTGENFPPEQLAELIINGVVISDTLETDADGTIRFQLSSDQADEGAYIVSLSLAPVETVYLKINNDLPVRPQESEGTTYPIPAGIALDDFSYLPVVTK
jgi:hypothetical protein